MCALIFEKVVEQTSLTLPFASPLFRPSDYNFRVLPARSLNFQVWIPHGQFVSVFAVMQHTIIVDFSCGQYIRLGEGGSPSG